MTTLRSELRRWFVSRWFVKRNSLSPRLAEAHVKAMTDEEVYRRMRECMRAGAEFAVGNAPKAEGQDAVDTQSGETVYPSVPVLDAANKPTTAGRKPEAVLLSADSRLSHPAKKGKRAAQQRLERNSRKPESSGVGFGVASRV
jgi:hypothetical protein